MVGQGEMTPLEWLDYLDQGSEVDKSLSTAAEDLLIDIE